MKILFVKHRINRDLMQEVISIDSASMDVRENWKKDALQNNETIIWRS